MGSYVTAQDVDDVYKAKRKKKGEILTREDGSILTQEGIDTVLYDLYTEYEKKGKGMGSRALAEFIANRDFVEFRRLLPRNFQALQQYCNFFKNAEDLNRIMISKEYPQIATSEQLRPFVDVMNPQNEKFNPGEAIVALNQIFKNNFERQNMKKTGKNGLEDCFDDENLRISTAQEAIKVVKNSVLGKEKALEGTGQQK